MEIKFKKGDVVRTLYRNFSPSCPVTITEDVIITSPDQFFNVLLPSGSIMLWTYGGFDIGHVYQLEIISAIKPQKLNPKIYSRYLKC